LTKKDKEIWSTAHAFSKKDKEIQNNGHVFPKKDKEMLSTAPAVLQKREGNSTTRIIFQKNGNVRK
jgi:hypothetical protein